VRIDEAHGAGLLVEHNAGAPGLIQQRAFAHLAHHLAYAGEKPGVVEPRCSHVDAVAPELARVPDQARGIRQRAHGNGAIVRGHAAESVTRKQRGSRSELGSADRGRHAGRARADDDNLHVTPPRSRRVRWLSVRSKINQRVRHRVRARVRDTRHARSEDNRSTDGGKPLGFAGRVGWWALWGDGGSRRASATARTEEADGSDGLEETRGNGHPEGGLLLENGRFGPLYPKTPARHGFTLIASARVGGGRGAPVRGHHRKGDHRQTRCARGCSELHHLRWVLFQIDQDMYFMYQGIFDTDFDKYTEDAVALFSKYGLNTVFENLEGFPKDWKTNVPAFAKFVREHQRPSFLEYSEYPYVSADEIKKALKLKEAFSGMLDQMQ
jgi:hypothetical protein